MVYQYCNNCQKDILPRKKFNIIIFLVLLCCFFPAAFIYLVFYLLRTPKCPSCGNKFLKQSYLKSQKLIQKPLNSSNQNIITPKSEEK